MRFSTKVAWLLTAVIILAATSCSNGNQAGSSTDATGRIYTQIASTALALQTQTALAIPSVTNTPQPSPTPQASDTPASSETPQPGAATATPLVLNTLVPTAQASCDNMEYVDDITYPDGYLAVPGENMVKTWRVKNLGPCTWNKKYALVFGWGGVGTDWNQTRPAYLTEDVLPGNTVDISVGLEAPMVKGEYGAFFVLRNDKGINFPRAVLTIYIKVQ